jgi:DNA-binding transcriptional regulator YdaS (Cro superfamily)
MTLAEYLDKKESQVALAKRLGVSQGLVWQWRTGRTRITAERAVQIETATEGAISRAELRPDLWPRQAA